MNTTDCYHTRATRAVSQSRASIRGQVLGHRLLAAPLTIDLAPFFKPWKDPAEFTLHALLVVIHGGLNVLESKPNANISRHLDICRRIFQSHEAATAGVEHEYTDPRSPRHQPHRALDTVSPFPHRRNESSSSTETLVAGRVRVARDPDISKQTGSPPVHFSGALSIPTHCSTIVPLPSQSAPVAKSHMFASEMVPRNRSARIQSLHTEALHGSFKPPVTEPLDSPWLEVQSQSTTDTATVRVRAEGTVIQPVLSYQLEATAATEPCDLSSSSYPTSESQWGELGQLDVPFRRSNRQDCLPQCGVLPPQSYPEAADQARESRSSRFNRAAFPEGPSETYYLSYASTLPPRPTVSNPGGSLNGHRDARGDGDGLQKPAHVAPPTLDLRAIKPTAWPSSSIISHPIPEPQAMCGQGVSPYGETPHVSPAVSPRKCRLETPPWLCPPSPSSLPMPSFLVRETKEFPLPRMVTPDFLAFPESEDQVMPEDSGPAKKKLLIRPTPVAPLGQSNMKKYRRSTAMVCPEPTDLPWPSFLGGKPHQKVIQLKSSSLCSSVESRQRSFTLSPEYDVDNSTSDGSIVSHRIESTSPTLRDPIVFVKSTCASPIDTWSDADFLNVRSALKPSPTAVKLYLDAIDLDAPSPLPSTLAVDAPGLSLAPKARMSPAYYLSGSEVPWNTPARLVSGFKSPGIIESDEGSDKENVPVRDIGELIRTAQASPNPMGETIYTSSAGNGTQNDFCVVHAPAPLRSRARPSFLDIPPPRRLSPDFLDRLSSATVGDAFLMITPMLCRPDQENMTTLADCVFKKAVYFQDTESAMQFLDYVFRFWEEGQLILSGVGTSSSGLQWIEFVLTQLAARIEQELGSIANMNSESMPLNLILRPLLDLLVHLQDFPLGHLLATFVVVLLKNAMQDENAGPGAVRRITYVFHYLSAKGRLNHDHYRGDCNVLRDMCTVALEEELAGLITCSINSSATEVLPEAGVPLLLRLASFLRLLLREDTVNILSTLPHRVLAMLNGEAVPPAAVENGSCEPQKSTAVLLLVLCSTIRAPGFVERVHLLQGNGWQDGFGQPCFVGAPFAAFFDYDFELARAYINEGNLREAFKVLLDLDAMAVSIKGWLEGSPWGTTGGDTPWLNI